MHKKTIKIISILIIFIYMFSISTIVFGEEIDPTTVVSNNPGFGSEGVDTLYVLGNAVLGILQFVGAGVAVIATIVLAMKYMYTSPDEKAEIKKKLIPVIMGGVMIFGGVQLVKVLEIFTGELIK